MNLRRICTTAAAVLMIGLISGQSLAEQRPIMLATTTSTDNSGLLKKLLPAFQQDTGYEVRVIAVGTGKALRMGRDGDVDVVLVHAPKAELYFVHKGHGVDREPVMYNDFVLVGPKADPAGLGEAKDAADALARIATSGSIFVSRGDDSGTHKKELKLWRAADTQPKGNWYREAGQGMGKVLQIAGELQAYTLTDRGTWLAYEDKSPLVIGYQGDPVMHNPYGIIAVNPQRHAGTNVDGARQLIKWITSPAGQDRISTFRINGKQLFVPSAHPTAKTDAGGTPRS